ncbi:hypothetical protein PTKU46_86600 [Paraburkholderia terrae]
MHGRDEAKGRVRLMSYLKARDMHVGTPHPGFSASDAATATKSMTDVDDAQSSCRARSGLIDLK